MAAPNKMGSPCAACCGSPGIGGVGCACTLTPATLTISMRVGASYGDPCYCSGDMSGACSYSSTPPSDMAPFFGLGGGGGWWGGVRTYNNNSISVGVGHPCVTQYSVAGRPRIWCSTGTYNMDFVSNVSVYDPTSGATIPAGSVIYRQSYTIGAGDPLDTCSPFFLTKGSSACYIISG